MLVLDRLAHVSPLILAGFAIGVVALVGARVVKRRARARSRRNASRRRHKQMGYNWSWREFWFAPRQRKLPPPRD